MQSIEAQAPVLPRIPEGSGRSKIEQLPQVVINRIHFLLNPPDSRALQATCRATCIPGEFDVVVNSIKNLLHEDVSEEDMEELGAIQEKHVSLFEKEEALLGWLKGKSPAVLEKVEEKVKEDDQFSPFFRNIVTLAKIYPNIEDLYRGGDGIENFRQALNKLIEMHENKRVLQAIKTHSRFLNNTSQLNTIKEQLEKIGYQLIVDGEVRLALDYIDTDRSVDLHCFLKGITKAIENPPANARRLDIDAVLERIKRSNRLTPFQKEQLSHLIIIQLVKSGAIQRATQLTSEIITEQVYKQCIFQEIAVYRLFANEPVDRVLASIPADLVPKELRYSLYADIAYQLCEQYASHLGTDTPPSTHSIACIKSILRQMPLYRVGNDVDSTTYRNDLINKLYKMLEDKSIDSMIELCEEYSEIDRSTRRSFSICENLIRDNEFDRAERLAFIYEAKCLSDRDVFQPYQYVDQLLRCCLNQQLFSRAMRIANRIPDESKRDEWKELILNSAESAGRPQLEMMQLRLSSLYTIPWESIKIMTMVLTTGLLLGQVSYALNNRMLSIKIAAQSLKATWKISLVAGGVFTLLARAPFFKKPKITAYEFGAYLSIGSIISLNIFQMLKGNALTQLAYKRRFLRSISIGGLVPLLGIIKSRFMASSN